MEFWKVLKEIMDRRGLSIPDVARMCNLPDSTIRSIIVRESQTVKLDVAFRISKGLDVSLEELNGEPKKEENADLREIDLIFQQLSEDNRSKLTELALLYLSAQNRSEGNQ